MEAWLATLPHPCGSKKRNGRHSTRATNQRTISNLSLRSILSRAVYTEYTPYVSALFAHIHASLVLSVPKHKQLLPTTLSPLQRSTHAVRTALRTPSQALPSRQPHRHSRRAFLRRGTARLGRGRGGGGGRFCNGACADGDGRGIGGVWCVMGGGWIRRWGWGRGQANEASVPNRRIIIVGLCIRSTRRLPSSPTGNLSFCTRTRAFRHVPRYVQSTP